jgi:hypothetical protein
MSWLRPFMILACALSAVGMVGCGPPPTGEVSGKITIQGQSPNIKGLAISFIGANGQMVGAPINEDGTYRASGIPAGEAKIGFIFAPGPGATGAESKQRFKDKGDPKGGKSPEVAVNPIPQALRDGSTSKLSVTVVANKNTVFDYDVK